MSQFQFDFSRDKLSRIIQNQYVNDWFDALNAILPDYEIVTVDRCAAFIAQCAHESAEFTRLVENLNYRADALTAIWPSRFPSSIAASYAHDQEKIANRAYANRMGNGNEASGDGWKYRGRGLIQLTGKSNYMAFADSVDVSLTDIMDYMNTFEGSVQSACWFWENNNLNSYADRGDISGMTKVINGGQLGLQDRISHYNHALNILRS